MWRPFPCDDSPMLTNFSNRYVPFWFYFEMRRLLIANVGSCLTQAQQINVNFIHCRADPRVARRQFARQVKSAIRPKWNVHFNKTNSNWRVFQSLPIKANFPLLEWIKCHLFYLVGLTAVLRIFWASNIDSPAKTVFNTTCQCINIAATDASSTLLITHSSIARRICLQGIKTW